MWSPKKINLMVLVVTHQIILLYLQYLLNDVLEKKNDGMAPWHLLKVPLMIVSDVYTIPMTYLIPK